MSVRVTMTMPGPKIAAGTDIESAPLWELRQRHADGNYGLALAGLVAGRKVGVAVDDDALHQAAERLAPGRGVGRKLRLDVVDQVVDHVGRDRVFVGADVGID